MKPNPYKHLLDANQPSPVVVRDSEQQQQHEQQQQSQAYIYNPQQYYASQQQAAAESNPNDQRNFTVGVVIANPFQNQEVQPPVITIEAIPNKNAFMQTIIITYIVQYVFIIGSVFIYELYKSEHSIFLQNNSITNLFWFVFLMTIIIPIVGSQIKAFHKNPTAVILTMIYTIIYALFQTGLIAISIKQQYSQDGERIRFGGYFILGIIGTLMTVFNIIGLIQLTVLSIMIKITGDSFQLEKYQRTGFLISIIIGMLFIFSNFVSAVSVGVLSFGFLFWFSFALTRVSNEKFGLKQNQAVFGSFAVFIVMLCPLINKI